MSRPKRCKVCKKVREHINRKGRCISCYCNKMNAINKQLRTKKGYYYKKWKRNLLSALKKL